MKTQDFLIQYIVVHIIPATDWGRLPYRRKKEYHYLITVSGKKIPLKALQAPAGCIDVVYVGSQRYAQDSGSLFTLLLDLSAAHPTAKIVYAEELCNGSGSPILSASRWLVQHMPTWLQRKILGSNSLLTLQSLSPFIY